MARTVALPPARPQDSPAWRRIRRRGGYTGIAVRRPRPRALVVRARAAGAGAHEARASPASIPRQVHPTARAGAAGAPRAHGGEGAGSLRRLRHDARAGARVGPRRGRRRHRRVQRVADARQDQAVQSRRAAPGPALGPCRDRRVRARGRYPRETSPFVRAWFAPAAEELLHARSLVEQVGSATCSGSCSHALRALRVARRISISISRSSPTWASTGATSTSAPAGPSGLRGSSCCAIPSTRSIASSPSRPPARQGCCQGPQR